MITSANAVLIMSIPLLLPVPQQIQDFAVDDIFDADDVDATDVAMSVDGFLTGGMVYSPKPMNFALMADSPSISFFEAWYTGQYAVVDALTAQGNITLTSKGRSYQLSTGFLSRYKPIPDAKKTLASMRFRVTWQNVLPIPIGTAG